MFFLFFFIKKFQVFNFFIVPAKTSVLADAPKICLAISKGRYNPVLFFLGHFRGVMTMDGTSTILFSLPCQLPQQYIKCSLDSKSAMLTLSTTKKHLS